MNEKKITLQFPLKANGALHTELTVRNPKVKDRLAAEKACVEENDHEIYLLALLVGLAPTDLHEPQLCDYAQLREALADFLRPSRPTSGKP